MLGIIKKDLSYLFSSKRERIFFLLYITFLSLIIDTYDSKWLYFAIIYSYTYLLCITSVSYENNSKINYVFNSLPITRKEIVVYKYLSFFVYLAMTIVYAGVYLWIINILGIRNVGYFNLEMIKKAIPMIMISLSIVFPAYLILGPKMAQIIHIIVFMVFFLGITISISSGEIFANKVFRFMESGRFLILVIVIYILSLILSIKLYENKDL